MKRGSGRGGGDLPEEYGLGHFAIMDALASRGAGTNITALRGQPKLGPKFKLVGPGQF